MIPNAVIASYVLALLTVPVVLIFHLLPTVFAGLAVYIQKWSNGLVQLSVTFKCKLLFHAAAAHCLGRVPQ